MGQKLETTSHLFVLVVSYRFVIHIRHYLIKEVREHRRGKRSAFIKPKGRKGFLDVDFLRQFEALIFVHNVPYQIPVKFLHCSLKLFEEIFGVHLQLLGFVADKDKIVNVCENDEDLITTDPFDKRKCVTDHCKVLH